MNPSTAQARVVVDELIRGGVVEAVLSPGSRNAPLSYALHAADAAGRLRLHVRIDERTAGFLALGLAKASGRPVVVVTTSGTAAVNLHPAVVEASYAGVPLLAITADRPPEARGTGANQTIDQVKLYGDSVRAYVEAPVAEDADRAQNASWRALVCRALSAARGGLTGEPGPVHLNVPFREPLVPDSDDDWPEALGGRADGGAWTALAPKAASTTNPYAPAPRTVVLVGDCSPDMARRAAEYAVAMGLPLVTEAVTVAGRAGLPAGGLLLGVPDFLAANRPERVLVVGRPTLSRTAQALLRDPAVAVDVVPGAPRWADPSGLAARVVPASALVPTEGQGDAGFLHAWREASAAAAFAVAGLLDAAPDAAPTAGPDLTGLHVARAVAQAAGESLLVTGSSSIVRDLDVVLPAGQPPVPTAQVLANRGAAGIDGMVSTAIGAALAVGGAGSYALLGDLTFLHDATALMIGPREPRPDLTIVVVNDDGGGIFARLEQGAPEQDRGGAFERVFVTPTGVDLAALCAASGTPHVRVRSAYDLTAALVPTGGLRVVETPVSRAGVRQLQGQLGAAVRAAVGGCGPA